MSGKNALPISLSDRRIIHSDHHLPQSIIPVPSQLSPHYDSTRLRTPLSPRFSGNYQSLSDSLVITEGFFDTESMGFSHDYTNSMPPDSVELLFTKEELEGRPWGEFSTPDNRVVWNRERFLKKSKRDREEMLRTKAEMARANIGLPSEAEHMSGAEDGTLSEHAAPVLLNSVHPILTANYGVLGREMAGDGISRTVTRYKSTMVRRQSDAFFAGDSVD